MYIWYAQINLDTCTCVIFYTVQYKILEGENLGEFAIGELKGVHQNVLVQTFPLKIKLAMYLCGANT